MTNLLSFELGPAWAAFCVTFQSSRTGKHEVEASLVPVSSLEQHVQVPFNRVDLSL